jgi:AcrR family transcriptional regulator
MTPRTAATARTPRAKGRPQTRPNEAAIFAASVESFGEKGFNGASMRDIATRAGTSLANLYNYVPSKDALLAMVLRQANDDLIATLQEGIPESKSARERLEAAVRAYVGWSIRSQTAGVVALGEFRYLRGNQRSEVVRARDTTQQIFTSIVEEGTAAGEFATPFPHEAARNIVLLCAALASWYRPEGPQGPDVVAAQQARLALAMVEARQQGGTRRAQRGA